MQFVKTYLSLHENQYYLKDHMVEDPIANVQFPKYAAGATLESGGKTHYFIDEATLREFQKQHGEEIMLGSASSQVSVRFRGLRD